MNSDSHHPRHIAPERSSGHNLARYVILAAVAALLLIFLVRSAAF